MAHWKTSLRSVLHRPAFTFTTISVLAFGIGANSALFSIIDTVLLRPLPYPQPDRVVSVMEANPAKSERASLIAPARLEDWNRLSRTFEALSGSYSENVTDTSRSEPERLAGQRVAPRYFTVFGTAPLIGRVFLSEEEISGGPQAAVISEGLWTRRYNRDPTVIERRLVLAGAGYSIVGVMPKNFAPSTIEVWIPAQLSAQLLRIREARFVRGVGRMKAGVTVDQARADLERVCARLGEQYPRTDKGWSATVTDYKQFRIGPHRRPLSLMFASAALLLLILCANIAGLLLGELQRRGRDLAIRASLGATRKQVAAVVFREVAILALLSGALGLGLALAGSRALLLVFSELPRIQELRFDWRITIFTVATTAITALVFGLIPAIQAMRRDLNSVLLQCGRTQSGGHGRLQKILVAVQFTVTLVLLAGAGLLMRSYYNLTRVQPGFEASRVITFHVGAEWGENREQIGLLQRQLVSELPQLPGVNSAGITNFLPASEATLREQVTVEGLATAGDAGKITTGTRMVSAGYLRALRVPLLQGSSCPDLALFDWTGPSRVLVNRRFMEVAGDSNLLGRHVIWSAATGMPPVEIVGVVGDVKEDALNAPVGPYVYACVAAGGWPDPEYVVAAQGDPRQVIDRIRELVHRLAPQRAIFGVTTLADRLDRSLDRPRLNAGLLGVFAGSALLSAALGLYGLVMLTMNSRTREIGVRIALGALPSRIVTQMAGEVLRPLGAAIVIGAAIGFLVLPSLRSVLFEVSPMDLLTFSCVCLLLVVVAAAAVVIPARRAAQIDPVEALRNE